MADQHGGGREWNRRLGMLWCRDVKQQKAQGLTWRAVDRAMNQRVGNGRVPAIIHQIPQSTDGGNVNWAIWAGCGHEESWDFSAVCFTSQRWHACV